MSLLILVRDKDNNYIASVDNSAFFFSQILPAYKKGTIGADEIYSLAICDTPVVNVGYWQAKWKGDERIRRLI